MPESHPKADPRVVYLDLRQKALGRNRASLGVSAGVDPEEAFGVVLDVGAERGLMTLAVFGEGSASIYTSSGGGFIGGQGRPSINEAAKRAVAAAAEFVRRMERAASCELPAPGEHVLYVLTDSGLRADRGSQQEFQSAHHPLAPLWMTCQDVITQFRILYPRPRS